MDILDFVNIEYFIHTTVFVIAGDINPLKPNLV
jgi:hypothetical protein